MNMYICNSNKTSNNEIKCTCRWISLFKCPAHQIPKTTSNKSDRVIALRLSTPLVYRKYDFFFFVTEFHIMMYTVCPGSNRSLSWAFVFNKHLIVEVTVIHDINKCMLMTRWVISQWKDACVFYLALDQ